MEAAILVPVLAIIAFGMIETALLLRDHVSATTLARAGARVASAEPRYGTVAGHNGGPSFAQDAADSVERAGATLPRRALDYIWVYDATNLPNPTASDCPGSLCVAYRWNDLPAPNGRFVYQGGSWDPDDINACIGDPAAQTVGVRIQVDHPWLVGFFPGTGTKVRATTVMKFEPLYPDHTLVGVQPGCK